jgi:hypothetical protein
MYESPGIVNDIHEWFIIHRNLNPMLARYLTSHPDASGRDGKKVMSIHPR